MTYMNPLRAALHKTDLGKVRRPLAGNPIMSGDARPCDPVAYRAALEVLG